VESQGPDDGVPLHQAPYGQVSLYCHLIHRINNSCVESQGPDDWLPPPGSRPWLAYPAHFNLHFYSSTEISEIRMKGNFVCYWIQIQIHENLIKSDQCGSE
jgi:hypothetical protein